MKLEFNVDYAYWEKGQKVDTETTKNLTKVPQHHIDRWIEDNVVMVIDEEKPKEPEEEAEKEPEEKLTDVGKVIEEAKKIYSKKELDKFASNHGVELDRRKSHKQMLKDFIKEVRC